MTKKTIIIACGVLFVFYLLFGSFLWMRSKVYVSPILTADIYIKAIQKNDFLNMYLYSYQLKPHLEGMLLDSNLSQQKQSDLFVKDYLRWSKTLKNNQSSEDGLSTERKLINRWVKLEPVMPEDYQAEVTLEGDMYLTSYQDIRGSTYHFYYRLTYPSSKQAPSASIFNNTANKRWKRIQSVIVRIEVQKRPTVGSWDSFLLGLDWLDPLIIIYPFSKWTKPQESFEVWMAKISFDVDKKTLTTY